jgi:hypothetical protein
MLGDMQAAYSRLGHKCVTDVQNFVLSMLRLQVLLPDSNLDIASCVTCFLSGELLSPFFILYPTVPVKTQYSLSKAELFATYSWVNATFCSVRKYEQ